MILSIITFILCILGIFGFYNDLIFLTYIGLITSAFEIYIEFHSGRLKSLFPQWICVILSIGAAFAGVNFFEALAITFCFENVIMFILGSLFTFFIMHTGYKLNKKDKDNKKENK